MSDQNAAAALPTATPLEEPLVCFCHGVTEAEIRKAIAEGATSLAAVQAKTLASTGCGGCTCEVERLLEEAATKQK